MAEPDHNPEHDEIEGTADPQTAELVAYLDGELPEQDADRVEQLLLGNPPLRRNAESLDRTWQLSNSLEEASASGEFTQKTLGVHFNRFWRKRRGQNNGSPLVAQEKTGLAPDCARHDLVSWQDSSLVPPVCCCRGKHAANGPIRRMNRS